MHRILKSYYHPFFLIVYKKCLDLRGTKARNSSTLKYIKYVKLFQMLKCLTGTGQYFPGNKSIFVVPKPIAAQPLKKYFCFGSKPFLLTTNLKIVLEWLIEIGEICLFYFKVAEFKHILQSFGVIIRKL